MTDQELLGLIRTLEYEIETFTPHVMPEKFDTRSYIAGYNNGARRGLIDAISRIREIAARQRVA